MPKEIYEIVYKEGNNIVSFKGTFLSIGKNEIGFTEEKTNRKVFISHKFYICRREVLEREKKDGEYS